MTVVYLFFWSHFRQTSPMAISCHPQLSASDYCLIASTNSAIPPKNCRTSRRGRYKMKNLNSILRVAQPFSLRGASRKLSLRLPSFEVSAVHHCMGGSQNFTLKQTTKPISLYLNYDIKRFSVQTAGASQQLRKAQIYHITCYALLMTICNSSFPCVFRCQRLPPCKAREKHTP